MRYGNTLYRTPREAARSIFFNHYTACGANRDREALFYMLEEKAIKAAYVEQENVGDAVREAFACEGLELPKECTDHDLEVAFEGVMRDLAQGEKDEARVEAFFAA